MSKKTATRLLTAATQRPGTFLGTYVLLLVVATHYPHAKLLPAPLLGFDKALHLVAYAGLAFLLATWLKARLGSASLVVVLLIVAAFGAVDELTQPYFNRGCDPFDWLADMLGAVIGYRLFRRGDTDAA